MSTQNTDTTASTTSTPRENVALHKNMTQSELYTNAGYLALNIWDRFDVFCTLGTTNAYIKGSSAAFNLIGLIGDTSASTAEQAVPNVSIGNAFVELYTDAEFSWSIGARGALWECGCATLGAEFQYAQAKPEISQINVVSNVAQFSIAHPKGFVGDLAKLPLPTLSGSGKPSDLSKAKSAIANYSEWQVGLALAYRLNFISPYVGIKWSRAKIDFDGAYVAQPQLETAKLNLLTWNPTLAGAGTVPGSTMQDVLTKVSVTLNKLKVKGLDPLYNRGSYTSIRLFCKKSLTSKPTLSLRAGFFGDYVFNRLLKTDVPNTFFMSKQASDAASSSFTGEDLPNIALHKNMTQSELYTNAGYLALNIWDRFDVFCTLGTTNAYIKGSSAAFNLVGLLGANDADSLGSNAVPNASVGNAFVELYTDAEFSWSVGARGALWECGCATLGAEFQYAQAKPEISQINVVSNVAQFSIAHPKGFVGRDIKLPLPTKSSSTAPDLSKTKSASVNCSEWQVGLALAYRLNFISPYVGIKWSRAKIDFDGAYIAQPQLETQKLDLITWNPTLAGDNLTATNDNKSQDVLKKVSVTLNKLKSRKSTGFVTGATLIDADKFIVEMRYFKL